MKKIIVLALLFCGVCSAYSQITQEMYDKKVEEIVNLKKQLEDAATSHNNMVATSQSVLKSLKDTINELKIDLSKLEKYKTEKKTIDAQFQQKNDSIVLLKTQLSEKDKQIATTKQQGDQKARDEKERGKVEALASIVNSYKNRQFDDLIKSSTKLSVERDRQLVGNNGEVKPILNDLSVYFNAEEWLAKKFDAAAIKNTLTQLNQIKQKSALLDKLKDNLEYYQDFNNALKETIGNLVNLDKRKEAGDDAEIQKLKLQEIATIFEVNKYIYNYYDYANYPHLSNIVLEIIKRKQSNADADITDLLQKL